MIDVIIQVLLMLVPALLGAFLLLTIFCAMCPIGAHPWEICWFFLRSGVGAMKRLRLRDLATFVAFLLALEVMSHMS